MGDKRQLERFELDAPAWIDIPRESGPEAHYLVQVQNISSEGAFVKLKSGELPVDERVDMTVSISVKKLTELFGMDDRVVLKMSGKVLRTESDGVAIAFTGKRGVYPAQ